MDILEKILGDVLILILKGPLDVKGGPDLLGRIGESLVKGPLKIVLDMSGVAYTDSTGLGALLRAARVTVAADGEIKLAGMQREILSVFKLAGIDRLFEINDTVEDAVNGF